MYEYYNRAKIFCLTSRDESFGLVYTEALSYGNFIVSTEVGAVLDITNNLEYGTLIENKNELAEKLESLITSETKLLNSYNFSMKYAKENFDWYNIIDKLEEKIKDVKRKD